MERLSVKIFQRIVVCIIFRGRISALLMYHIISWGVPANIRRRQIKESSDSSSNIEYFGEQVDLYVPIYGVCSCETCIFIPMMTVNQNLYLFEEEKPKDAGIGKSRYVFTCLWQRLVPNRTSKLSYLIESSQLSNIR